MVRSCLGCVPWLALLVMIGCGRTHSSPGDRAGNGGTGASDAGPDQGAAGSVADAGAAGDAAGVEADGGALGAAGDSGASTTAGSGGAAVGGGGASGAAGTSVDAGGTAGSAGDTLSGGSGGSGGAQPSGGMSGGAGSSGHSGAGGGQAGTAGAVGTAGTAGSASGCGADNFACSPSNGVQGFCKTNSCVTCASAADNASCSAAYGNGAGYVCANGSCVTGACVSNSDCSNGQLCGLSRAHECGNCMSDQQCAGARGNGAGYLCITGSCVLADCRTSAECGTGQICGLNAPNLCAGCNSDSQCRIDPGYGSGFVCDTSSALCVSDTCTTNNRVCDANHADFCCAGSCVPGSCCRSGDCTSLGNNYACVDHTCTQCPQATGNAYFVDPVAGSDAVGTGDHSTAGCAFRSITRALAVIGANPNPGTKVWVLTTGSVASDTNAESFPIDVPANVIISGSGGRAQIMLPANTNGFLLHNGHSGLANLTIDGQNQTAAYGVSVTAGSDATTTLSALDVQNMGHDGIRVAGSGVVSVQSGVHATHNGTTAAPADGLHVGDQASAIIDVTSGDAVHFDNNTAHGIYVNGAGSIQLTGTPGTAGTGTVTTNANVAAGLWIEQTPTNNSVLNTVTGLVAWANAGNGARIVAGSALVLRDSVMLANGSNGLMVSTSVNGNTRNNDTSKIDLGTRNGSNGRNTFQASLGSNPNAAAGICLSLDRLAGSMLNAVGNRFSGPTDCAGSTAMLTKNNRCSGAVDYSVRSNGASSNAIVVSSCR